MSGRPAAREVSRGDGGGHHQPESRLARVGLLLQGLLLVLPGFHELGQAGLVGQSSNLSAGWAPAAGAVV